MKRTIILTLVLVITLLSCLTVSATDTKTTGNTYVVDDVTVIFDASSTLTAEEQQFIAEYLVRGGEIGETYSLACSLFGHKYMREVATTVTHCVRESDPRCKEDLYEVNTCERCGHAELKFISDTYISCCK